MDGVKEGPITCTYISSKMKQTCGAVADVPRAQKYRRCVLLVLTHKVGTAMGPALFLPTRRSEQQSHDLIRPQEKPSRIRHWFANFMVLITVIQDAFRRPIMNNHGRGSSRL